MLPLTPSTLAAAWAAWVIAFLVYRIALERRRTVPPPPLKGWAAHARDVTAVRAAFCAWAAHRKPGQRVVLNRSRGGHADSNRTLAAAYKSGDGVTAVDVSALDGVIALDEAGELLHVEPSVPQDELARQALARGWVPAVVPEFPGITAGGAFSGGGIESTSHRAGSVLDTVVEFDVITGDGTFIQGVSRSHHPDLFASAATGFGSLGVITRLALRIERAPRFVTVSYLHLGSVDAATAALEALADGGGPSVPPPTKALAKAAAATPLRPVPTGDAAPVTTAPTPLVAPPDFLDGVALSDDSAIVVLAQPSDGPTRDAPLLELRASRSAPWFFWHLADIARSAPAMPGPAWKAAWATVVAAKGISGPRGPGTLGPRDYPGCVRVETLPTEDYLFRFDRGAFWMARHGLQTFYGRAAWREADGSAYPGTGFLERLAASRAGKAVKRKSTSTAAASSSSSSNSQKIHRPGPSWPIRVKYAWIGTTRQLYRILHRVGDETIARCYVVQDFILPSAAAAASFVRDATAPPGVLGIWPLWLCPVRHVRLPGSGGAGFGFPYSTSTPGCVWINVGVYGLPHGGAGGATDPVVINRALEAAATERGGRKMLYAQSYYSPAEFDALFDMEAYGAARKTYAAAPGKKAGDFSFPDAPAKLLLGDARRERLSGAKHASLLAAWKPMVPWYASIWAELCLPRFLHPFVGVHHTGMEAYAAMPAKAVAAEAAAAAAERKRVVAGGGSGGGKAPAAAAGTAARRATSPRRRTVRREE
jgi:Delta24-sterol reductase